jgi:hypothetical protein
MSRVGPFVREVQATGKCLERAEEGGPSVRFTPSDETGMREMVVVTKKKGRL